jgi:hypothetical protein
VGADPANPILAVATAANVPLLAVVHAADVLLVNTASSLHPMREGIRPLPPALAAARMRRVALSPDGRQLAFCLGQGNRVAVVDLGRDARPQPDVAEVALVPETRVPVLADLVFAPDGRTLWVVSGDSTESRPLGQQPTRVVALRIGRAGDGALTLEPARSVSVPAAGEPSRLATGRTLPLASGATVRLPPERATVYLAAGVRGSAGSAVFSIDAADLARELVAAPSQLAAVDVTPEGRWLLSAALISDGGVRVLSTPLDGGASQELMLAGDGARAGGGSAELHIQP